MSERALKTALGVLVGLLFAYALTLFLGAGRGGGSDGVALARGLADLSRDGVELVTLVGPSDTVELASEGGVWTVDGHPTEATAVDRLWDAVTQAQVGDLVASNPQNHGRMGVAEDSTWSVTFHRLGGDDLRILVGKTGPSFTSAYVRLPDEDAVYVVDGGLRGAVSRRADDWRDRTIVVVDTTTVAHLVIERDGASAELSRSDGLWVVDGSTADTTVVRNLFRELSSLEATGFAPEENLFEGGDLRTLVVLDAQGDTLAAVEIRIEGDDVWARTAGNPVVFRLSAFRSDRVVPDLVSLVQSDPQ